MDPTLTTASRELHGKIDVIGIDLDHLMVPKSIRWLNLTLSSDAM